MQRRVAQQNVIFIIMDVFSAGYFCSCSTTIPTSAYSSKTLAEMEELAEQQRCDTCRVAVHPCSKCLPGAPCLARSGWNPSMCLYCINGALTMNNPEKTPACKIFLSKKKYQINKVLSGRVDIFVKDIDVIAFGWIVKKNPQLVRHHKLEQHDCWDQHFFREAAKIARQTSQPYEALKLCNEYFKRKVHGLTKFSQVIKGKAEAATSSSPRPSQRGSSKQKQGSRPSSASPLPQQPVVVTLPTPLASLPDASPPRGRHALPLQVRRRLTCPTATTSKQDLRVPSNHLQQS